MGSKLRHAHVRTDDGAAVAEALCARALANAFSLAPEGQPCDHEVVVTTDPASPGWTSIYNPFGAFLWELSDALTTQVVELELFDGDVLYARLCSDGCEVDAFCTDPAYANLPARSAKGQPKRWDGVCAPGKSWRDVQRVFKSAPENAEQGLVELGKVLGLDARSLYPDHVDPAGPGVRRLRFRRPPSPRRRILTSAPVAELPAEGALELTMGGGARPSGVVVRSKGGGSDGVEVAFGGAAIAAGLVTIDAVEYRSAPGALAARGDDARLVATFAKAGFPAASGLVKEEEAEPQIADQWPSVHVGFTVRPLRPGDGELEVTFRPIEPEGAPCTGRWRLRVSG